MRISILVVLSLFTLELSAAYTSALVPGCTDVNANNYDPLADEEDASCTYDLTFQVDMSDQTVPPEGAFLTGDFQDWDPSTTALTDNGDGTWELTISVSSGQVLNYKYLNGNAWGLEETVPGVCGADDGFGGFNRAWTVSPMAEVIPLHCFASCEACPLEAVDVTFQVDMSQETVSPDGVHLAGSFQGWDAGATPMSDEGGGIWSLTLPLNPLEEVEYKFINGNVWGADEMNPAECTVNGNRFATIPTMSVVLDPVCFSYCVVCSELPVPGCIFEEAVNYNALANVDDGSCMFTVEFNVDMSDETVSPDGVHIAGDFQGWDTSTNPMIDLGDGVWSVALVVAANQTIQYKFINGMIWGEEELVPNECQQIGNRFLVVEEANVILETLCFASCVACGEEFILGCLDETASNYNEEATDDDGSCVFEVTFIIDMSETSVLPEGLHLAGDFQGWDPTSILMEDQGGQVFVYTTSFAPGTSIEYKYVNGTDWSQAEAVPLDCGVLDGFNGYQRTFITSGVPETIPIHCFSSCVACSGCVGLQGCTYPDADNYDPLAEIDDSSCIFSGCTDATAVNYNAMATVDDNSCIFSIGYCGEGTIWDEVSQTCITDPGCPADLNGDDLINATDLLLFLGSYGSPCE